MAKSEMKLHTLISDMTSETYHGLTGTWSSSQFKDMIDDEEIFIRKHVKKEIPRKENENFDTGTYFHTALLEPHKVDAEIAVYPGSKRMGEKWTAFQKKHSKKMIITQNQKDQGDSMIKSVKASKVATKYLVGKPEISLFTQIYIDGGEIYAPEFGKVLTRNGWEDYSGVIESDAFELIVKVRSDTLGKTFISDLKSTSGNARSSESVRYTISKYKYDLSAALYLDMFSLVLPQLKSFVWIFASKSVNNAGTWVASKDQISIGRAKYMRAMIQMAKCHKNKWAVVDELLEVDPLPHEYEWIKEKETDLL